MNSIYDFNSLPTEIKNLIISLTTNKVYDLCLVDQYFNDNCRSLGLLRILVNIQKSEIVI